MISQSPLTAALRAVWEKSPLRSQDGNILVGRIRQEAARYLRVPDKELSQRMAELRECVSSGVSPRLPEILVPAFALTLEAARRALKITLYDVQLLAGIALVQGAIAEMQTGEGKTFAALLPAVAHSLSGEGVHVMTVNTYLAQRDFTSLKPVYERLGLTAGMIDSQSSPQSKRAAYACDITYGTGCEFGFDYLRDQLALMSARKPQLGERFRSRLRGQAVDTPVPLQRGHAVAIVDEADSVMIDEATTPLLLAIGGNEPSPHAEVYQRAMRVADRLIEETHFTAERPQAGLRLTRKGIEHLAEESHEVPGRGLVRPWQAYVENALRAKHRYQRDLHYVVREGEIQLVDQYTGRISADRTWRDGMQQAVQAKEGVCITVENRSMARISRQRFFGRYRLVCGMTGTARGSERELHSSYGLGVAVIPPHRPCRRVIFPLRAFATADSKYRAIVEEIIDRHGKGQPVLVGTGAIQTSELLAGMLRERGIAFQLLNGKQDAEEAEIIAAAGQPAAVTIATNMAGRGTDIHLSAEAAALGGLHVVAVEPQESIRVDRQLVGRAARQGDPGSAQTFVSADDPLLQRHDHSLAQRLVKQAGPDGEVADAADLEQSIARTQRRVETAKYRQRRDMFAHDDWLERILRELG